MAPILLAELDTETARRRSDGKLEAFRKVARGDSAEARIAYFEARLAESAGDLARAADKYREVIGQDSSQPQAFVRLARCFLAQNRDGSSEREIRKLIERAKHPSLHLWHLWLALSFADLGRSPAEVLEKLPRRSDPPPPHREAIPFCGDDYHRDLRWLLQELHENGVVRINCGGGEHRDGNAETWGRDRFFTAGNVYHSRQFERPIKRIKKASDVTIYRSERWFHLGGVTGYRVPLPRGRYRITLHFAELIFRSAGQRVFDAVIEGEPVKTGTRLDPAREAGLATAHTVEHTHSVEDGVLDIEFVARVENPKVSAIEIERISK